MTPQDIINALTAAGFTTPDQVSAFIQSLANLVALKNIDLQIDALNAQQSASLSDFSNQRTQLVNQKATAQADLGAAVSAQLAAAPKGP